MAPSGQPLTLKHMPKLTWYGCCNNSILFSVALLAARSSVWLLGVPDGEAASSLMGEFGVVVGVGVVVVAGWLEGDVGGVRSGAVAAVAARTADNSCDVVAVVVGVDVVVFAPARHEQKNEGKGFMSTNWLWWGHNAILNLTGNASTNRRTTCPNGNWIKDICGEIYSRVTSSLCEKERLWAYKTMYSNHLPQSGFFLFYIIHRYIHVHNAIIIHMPYAAYKIAIHTDCG